MYAIRGYYVLPVGVGEGSVGQLPAHVLGDAHALLPGGLGLGGGLGRRLGVRLGRMVGRVARGMLTIP